MKILLLLVSALSLHAQSVFFSASQTGAAATPTFSPTAGTVTAGTVVTISTATSGCSGNIYWNTTGSPTVSDTNGTSVTVNSTQTIYAKVINCSGYQDSGVGSAAYTVITPPSDTFTGSAGTSLQSHTSDSGHTWTSRQGAIELDGSGNAQYVSETNSFGAVYWTSWAPSSADYAAQLTVSGGTTDQYYLFARMTATTSGYRCGYLGAAIGLRCSVYTGGSVTTILGTVPLAALTNGDVLRMEVSGTSIVFKRNGVTQINATDSVYSAAGSTGFALRSGAKITAWSAE